MGVTIGLNIAAGLLLLGVCWAYGRLKQTSLWADWQTLLTNRGRGVYLKASERFGQELGLVDMTFGMAHGLRSTETAEAVRILGAAYDVLADTAPSLGCLLTGLSRLSRMASAFAPTAPPDAASFQDLRLRRLAWWGRVLHVPLVSSAERYRLRTYVLGLEVRTLSRYLLESTRRLEEKPDADSPRWAEIEALVADYHTVTDETLASLRALVASAERH